jgi:hypothetical protein
MNLNLRFFLDWQEYFAAQEFFRRQSADLLARVALLVSKPLRRLAFHKRWQREPLFQQEHQVSFDHDGLYFRMGQIESNLPWPYYESFAESADGFLLIYGDSFNLLPKRVFADEVQINELRKLLAKNLRKNCK